VSDAPPQPAVAPTQPRPAGGQPPATASRGRQQSATDAAKRLALIVGAAVLIALVFSLIAGYAISAAGGVAAVTVLRDLGLIILSLFTLVFTFIWLAIYFVAAWGVGHFGRRLPAGIRWAAEKVATASQVTERGAERFAVRPLAGVARRLTTARALTEGLAPGPALRQDLSRRPDATGRSRHSFDQAPTSPANVQVGQPAGPVTTGQPVG
jgi:hypothetical protein